MSRKLRILFILGVVLIVVLLEAGLLSGALFSKNVIALAAISLLLAIAAVGASCLITFFLLKKHIKGPLNALAGKLEKYGMVSEAALLQEDPVSYIERVTSRMKTAADAFAGRASTVQKLHETIVTGFTTNSLIRGATESLKTVPSAEAGMVILVDKKRGSATTYPICPEDICVHRELPLGAGGISPNIAKINTATYKERLASNDELNDMEKIFLGRSYVCSFIAPMMNADEFFGILGVASKKEGGIQGEDRDLVEAMANLLALKFNALKLSQELRKKTDEVIELKHSGKEQIEKQLKELKAMYQQVVQAGKMTSLGQLSAGVAHELNNPIGGILGYAQLILAKLKNADITKQDISDSVRYLEMMERESKRCQWIVSNLLNFSRKPLDERMDLDVKDVIENTASMMEFQLAKSEIKAVLNFPPGGLKKINGNSNELQQVFTNLIQNAIDAMPTGGTLTITAANKVDARYRPPFEFVEITFSDTGAGIPKENLARLFEPFFTSKIGKPGTGLGLSITYTIINTHKGMIAVDSEEGKGTTFIIVLPSVKSTPT